MKLVDLSPGDLTSLMPMEKIVESLDDNAEGAIDMAAWESVVAQVNERLVALCGSADAVRDRAPRYAAKVFAAQTLYVRRGFAGQDNPITALANAQERALAGNVSGGAVVQEQTAFGMGGSRRVVS